MLFYDLQYVSFQRIRARTWRFISILEFVFIFYLFVVYIWYFRLQIQLTSNITSYLQAHKFTITKCRVHQLEVYSYFSKLVSTTVRTLEPNLDPTSIWCCFIFNWISEVELDLVIFPWRVNIMGLDALTRDDLIVTSYFKLINNRTS